MDLKRNKCNLGSTLTYFKCVECAIVFLLLLFPLYTCPMLYMTPSGALLMFRNALILIPAGHTGSINLLVKQIRLTLCVKYIPFFYLYIFSNSGDIH